MEIEPIDNNYNLLPNINFITIRDQIKLINNYQSRIELIKYYVINTDINKLCHLCLNINEIEIILMDCKFNNHEKRKLMKWLKNL